MIYQENLSLQTVKNYEQSLASFFTINLDSLVEKVGLTSGTPNIF